jgi:hypothetical protein
MGKSSDSYKGERRVQSARPRDERREWDSPRDFSIQIVPMDSYYEYEESLPMRNTYVNMEEIEDHPAREVMEKQVSTDSLNLLVSNLLQTGDFKSLELKVEDSTGVKKYNVTLEESTVTPEETEVSDHHQSTETNWTIKEEVYHKYIGLKMFSSLIELGHYSSFTGGSIDYGAYSGWNNRHSLSLGYGLLPVSGNSDLFGSIKNTGQFQITYQYCRYAPFGISFENLYAKLEGTPSLRYWTYRNPVYSDIIDDDGNVIETEEITGDGLFGFSFGLGMGFSFINLKHFETIIDGTFGLTLFSGETTRGFENDVFYDELFVKLSLGFIFK